MAFQKKIAKVILSGAGWVILSLNPTAIQAQSETSNWFFGRNAGVSFKSGSPIAIGTGKLNTIEGCASISDSVGNLLFYTEGIHVWNKFHQLMPNGTDLNGHLSSTQSAYIVPKPGSNSIYYIFTTDFEASKKGLCYSMVDMKLNNGTGAVYEKNTLLKENCVEKIAAYEHANQQDIWLIIHQFNTNSFLTYLITKNGISTETISSAIGLKHEKSIYNTIGYMKFSPNGKKLAVIITGSDCSQVLDFDNKTGKISNPITIQLPKGSMPYGLEFSLNNKLLYIGTGGKGKVFQVNIDLQDNEQIMKSIIQIGQSKSGKSIGALQLAEDKKIYVIEYLSTFLSVIENPDIPGTGCNYNSEKINLNRVTTFGLPICYKKNRQTLKYSTATDYNNKNEIVLNQKYILKNILFDTDKSDLKNEFLKDLDKIVDYLKSSENLKISIIGHTDSIGKAEYNYQLSLRRANQIRDYLYSKEINQNQIITMGKGFDEPIDLNSTEYGRKQNRRVEFIITKTDTKQKTEP